MGKRDMQQHHETGTSRIDREEDISANEDSPSLALHQSIELDGRQNNSYDQLLRTAVISILVFWVVIALGAGMYEPGSGHLSS